MNNMEYNEEHLHQIQRGLIGLHKYRLQRLPHIKKYHKLRKMHQEISQKMIDFSYEHPDLIYVDKQKYRQEYQMMQSIHLNMDDEMDKHMMLDAVVYPYGINKDACTYFLEHKKVRTVEKMKFVECMRESKLGIYEVMSCESSQGTCEIRNVLTGERKTLVDESLSIYGEQLKDRFYMWRVIEVDGICFQTGFTFLYQKENLRKWLKKHKGYEIRIKELIELYRLRKHETGSVFNIY